MAGTGKVANELYNDIVQRPIEWLRLPAMTATRAVRVDCFGGADRRIASAEFLASRGELGG